jgi:uncharacterized protein YggT (Ycf19 family)
MPSVKTILQFAIWLMMMAIFGSVIISWLRNFRVNVPHYHPVVRLIEDTADIMLRPIRRAFPTSGGGLDFSPMVAIIILYIFQALLARL